MNKQNKILDNSCTSHDATKPVLGVSNQILPKPVGSATETT